MLRWFKSEDPKLIYTNTKKYDFEEKNSLAKKLRFCVNIADCVAHLSYCNIFSIHSVLEHSHTTSLSHLVHKCSYAILQFWTCMYNFSCIDHSEIGIRCVGNI